MAPHDTIDLPAFSPVDAAAMFEFAPIALLAEDFSALKRLFTTWRAAGVSDLGTWLREDHSRIIACWNAIRILGVNQQSFALFAPEDLADLVESTKRIYHPDMLPGLVEELVQLWTNGAWFSVDSVNTAAGGRRRMDIRLHGRILPGHLDDWSRAIVAIQDITAESDSHRCRAESEAFGRAMFDESPVSLWAYDFSEVKALLESLRAAGVTDMRAHLATDPEIIQAFVQAMRPLDVNRHTLNLYGAPDKETLFRRRMDTVFAPESIPYLREKLIKVWQHGPFIQHETVHGTLTGERLTLLLNYSLMPGHEADWSLVLVALTDITARKKAEEQLAWLSAHDAPTGLHNRQFYLAEIERLARAGPFPISVLIADLNGLKPVNDNFGHDAGDLLLSRAGKILGHAIAPGASATPAGAAAAGDAVASAARIGGDEFVLLLPGTDAAAAAALQTRIEALIADDNALHTDHPLSLSIGRATATTPGPLGTTIRQADLAMYQAKRAFYAANPTRSHRR